MKLNVKKLESLKLWARGNEKCQGIALRILLWLFGVTRYTIAVIYRKLFLVWWLQERFNYVPRVSGHRYSILQQDQIKSHYFFKKGLTWLLTVPSMVAIGNRLPSGREWRFLVLLCGVLNRLSNAVSCTICQQTVDLVSLSNDQSRNITVTSVTCH